MYFLLYAFLWLVTWLPLRVLYLFSDLFFLLVYYVAGYRKKVVRKNLEKSFPDKTPKERRVIERKFYRFFADIFIETVKQMHMSDAQTKRRMTYENVELITAEYAKGRSVMVMSSHFGNWEWSSSLSLFLPPQSPAQLIYRRLKNKNIDGLMTQLRTKYGGLTIEKNNLLRTMVRMRSEGKICTFGMISDQSPSANNIHLCVPFLHQNTPVLTGTEELAKKFDYPVFYARFTKKKRGYYHCKFVPITLEPRQTGSFEISRKYMEILESQILEEPHLWLWSHKRWKHASKAVC